MELKLAFLHFCLNPQLPDFQVFDPANALARNNANARGTVTFESERHFFAAFSHEFLGAEEFAGTFECRIKFCFSTAQGDCSLCTAPLRKTMITEHERTSAG